MNTKEYILTFARTHDAMLAEQVLMDSGIRPGVMPLPSSIRAGCGLCLRVAPASRFEALRSLESAGCTPQDIYCRTVQDGKSAYEKCTEEAHDASR